MPNFLRSKNLALLLLAVASLFAADTFRVVVTAPTEATADPNGKVNLQLGVTLEKIVPVPPVHPPVDPPVDPPAGNCLQAKPSMTVAAIQALLDAAEPGDSVEFLAGQYVGQWKVGSPGVTLYSKGGAVLRTNSLDAYGAVYVLASDVTVKGLEITSTAGIRPVSLLTIGDYAATSIEQQPKNVAIEDNVIHGDATIGARRGISSNAGRGLVVQRNHVYDIKADVDSIAFWGGNGVGGWKIVNNRLSSAGECLLFGGSPTKIVGHTIEDVLIEGNEFYKDQTLRSEPSKWSVKNLLELKRGRRITIRGNTLHGNWAGAHMGFGLVLTMRAESGQNPWLVLEDILIEGNKLYAVGGGINILGCDYNSNYRSNAAKRITVRDNLIIVDKTRGEGRAIQILTGAEDLLFENNTVLGEVGQTPKFAVLVEAPHDGPPAADGGNVRLPILNLTMHRNILGGPVFGSGLATGDKPLQVYCRNADVTDNYFVPGTGAPSGNKQVTVAVAVDGKFRSKLAGYGSALSQ